MREGLIRCVAAAVMHGNDASSSGLIRLADDAYGTSPTRGHEVLVMREGNRWITWAGWWNKKAGSTPSKEWTLYQGTSLHAAIHAATKFAGRFERWR